jgi:hypothetical protein
MATGVSGLMTATSASGGSATVYLILAGFAGLAAAVYGFLWYWLRDRASAYRLRRLRTAARVLAVLCIFSLVRAWTA